MTRDYLICPYCEYEHDLCDYDVYNQITSYHGDVEHEFTCCECDKDFKVIETVVRTWGIKK